MTRSELEKLVAAYKGPIHYPMVTRYRYVAKSGKIVQPKVRDTNVKYCRDAYRADKKRAGHCDRDLYLGNPASVNSYATRDY